MRACPRWLSCSRRRKSQSLRPLRAARRLMFAMRPKSLEPIVIADAPICELRARVLSTDDHHPDARRGPSPAKSTYRRQAISSSPNRLSSRWFFFNLVQSIIVATLKRRSNSFIAVSLSRILGVWPLSAGRCLPRLALPFGPRAACWMPKCSDNAPVHELPTAFVF